ncbi:hypothetical protein [Polyangium spumosum]|uniref:Uncharacterized protein n=1 Tax=Polyangium spumosum TaxID=889282 RepID=A0A6N7PVZ1_9BACT|nr:hypothetical protein [Polyangium spumosum]MRG96228.1 hypothetical protein [Polyangium spumosum]
MSFEPDRRLADPDELLHRQVHPTFLRDGRVTSQAFGPTPKDEGGLSVSRDARASAEEAYRRHTEQKQLKSAGVWSVTVGECNGIELNAYEDAKPEDDAHALVDFRGLSKGMVEKKAKQLAEIARQRGRTFPGSR